MREAFFCSEKLTRMFRIFSRQNLLAMSHKFMPNLLTYGHYRRIVTEIRANRIHKYFQVLKKPVILNKMERFLERKRTLMRIKRTFAGLRATRSHMQAALHYADEKYVQAQDRLLKEYFGRLKSFLYLKRCRRFALGGHAIHIVAKAFSSLKKHACKSILLRQAIEVLDQQRKQKYLDLWVQEFDKSTRGQHAESVLNFATAH
jgi:hypothetical protein